MKSVWRPGILIRCRKNSEVVFKQKLWCWYILCTTKSLLPKSYFWIIQITMNSKLSGGDCVKASFSKSNISKSIATKSWWKRQVSSALMLSIPYPSFYRNLIFYLILFKLISILFEPHLIPGYTNTTFCFHSCSDQGRQSHCKLKSRDKVPPLI